jgi:hypothetical protein
MSNEDEELEYIEFIRKHNNFTSVIFTLNYNNLRKNLKITKVYFKLKFTLLKIFLYKIWITYSKFCYSINLNFMEKRDKNE